MDPPLQHEGQRKQVNQTAVAPAHVEILSDFPWVFVAAFELAQPVCV